MSRKTKILRRISRIALLLILPLYVLFTLTFALGPYGLILLVVYMIALRKILMATFGSMMDDYFVLCSELDDNENEEEEEDFVRGHA